MEPVADKESGVFSPKELVSLTHTPVSKKTRSAFRKQENEPVKDGEVQPKTPKVVISAGEEQTPRRSARKSVRPPLDYEDIMGRSASKATVGDRPVTIDNQNEEMETHKWSAAEVGKHSAKVKRSRKSKRAAAMQIKEQIHINADNSESNVKSPAQAIKSNIKIESVESDAETAKLVLESDVKSENLDKMVVPGEPNSKLAFASENLNEMDAVVKSEKGILDSAVESKDMEELGICPLEFGEEMPSLIVLDDDNEESPDSGETVLNTTFDADPKEDEQVFEMDMPTLQISPEKNSGIDGDLTQPVHEVSTAMNTDQIADIKKTRSFRFPTPYKSKVVKQFRNPSNLATNEEITSTRRQRRSNSFCSMQEIKAKSVSFLSPIEVTHVHDIDKRWEDFNKSNVTNRRRRSKSLDENIPKVSRLPQPKVYPKVYTPNKLNSRTKLPNFAAMHQKQFDKMENLVDHLERKAERAKALTNSALKQKQTAGSITTVAEERSRQPRALKKLDISTASKFQEVQRPLTRGATPAKGKANISMRAPLTCENSFAAKPAFNLSTSLAKTFHARALPPSNGNKVEQRRQRHMDMFKGRAAKDTKGDFIKGVRLNRRFELQMQHRRVMDEED